MKRILATLVLIASATAANAGTITIFGQPSCGEWLGNGTTADQLRADSWVVGYMSGLNANESEAVDVLAGVDVPSMRSYIDNFCRANPLEKVAKGAQAMYLNLFSRKLKAKGGV